MTVRSPRVTDVLSDGGIVRAPQYADGELYVLASRVVRGFVIETTFRDGFIRSFDMSRDLTGIPERFKELLDPAYFERGAFDPELGTIAWPNGFDLSPEFLRWGPDPARKS